MLICLLAEKIRWLDENISHIRSINLLISLSTWKQMSVPPKVSRQKKKKSFKSVVTFFMLSAAPLICFIESNPVWQTGQHEEVQSFKEDTTLVGDEQIKVLAPGTTH